MESNVTLADLLDPNNELGLRVKCELCHGTLTYETVYCIIGRCPQYGTPHPICHPCIVCLGRGWTPSTELMLYVRAAWSLSDLPDGTCGDTLAANVMAAIQAAFNAAADPAQAAFDVVWEALKR